MIKSYKLNKLSSNIFKKAWSLYFLIGVLLFPMIASSALNDDSNPVLIKSINVEFKEAASILKVECELSIPKPWHVNSDSLKQDYLIPTAVIIKDTTIGKRVKKKYPKPVLRNVFGQELSLFEGELKFSNYFYLDKKNFPFEIVLQYQSCSDKICLPPVFTKYSLLKEGKLIKAVLK